VLVLEMPGILMACLRCSSLPHPLLHRPPRATLQHLLLRDPKARCSLTSGDLDTLVARSQGYSGADIHQAS
jgi:hypothetical protein